MTVSGDTVSTRLRLTGVKLAFKPKLAQSDAGCFIMHRRVRAVADCDGVGVGGGGPATHGSDEE